MLSFAHGPPIDADLFRAGRGRKAVPGISEMIVRRIVVSGELLPPVSVGRNLVWIAARTPRVRPSAGCRRT